ncbi:CinA family protein [Corynebacterium halotolerans]|uniref:Competence-and mitomycin-induced protein n=1 Tax=Corynebacterium halotolerans YIM 70093 = DSM 44683 TaxID=1121362 RepID=M1MY94_9CORY|nr:CinA family protein [Corynebacterium halotolerans]AGF72704.1 competence-and mitomycin-induced protein [Corynebacterium halotolerans YIM 70093 = DSM 44683]
MTLAEELVAALRAKGQTVAFCESLTAGLASATLADVPGASAVLRGGLVTYATDLKGRLAGVPEKVLEEHGPVSEETAAAMALGAHDRCGADWAVALTGVAGPDPQDGHPVGEVWLGLAGPGIGDSRGGGGATVRTLRAESPGSMRSASSPREPDPVPVIDGDRRTIRAAAVDAAFRALLTGVRAQEETR